MKLCSNIAYYIPDVIVKRQVIYVNTSAKLAQNLSGCLVHPVQINKRRKTEEKVKF